MTGFYGSALVCFNYFKVFVLMLNQKLGISLFFAARGISAELHNVRKLAEITKLEKEEPIIGQATEDGIFFTSRSVMPSYSS